MIPSVGETRAGPLRRLLESALGAIDRVAFPVSCAICEAGPMPEPICEDCRAELLGAAGDACPRCAEPVGPYGLAAAEAFGGCSSCRGRRLGFDSAFALGPYEGPIRHLCLRLKHARDAWLGRWLADLIVEARGTAILAGLDRSGRPPLVVPVPLHWTRRLTRGGNQAEEIADRLATRLGLKRARGLRRVRPTRKLAGRGRVERARELRGAFRADRPKLVEGREVLLVDDILTTGATCGAAARALKRAGASRVVVVVAARAGGRA